MRTEDEVLKDFKKLGYNIYNDENHLILENMYNDKCMAIGKLLQTIFCYKRVEKSYETIINGNRMEMKYYYTAEPNSLLINEFELLHELFKIWGWL